TPFPYTTLFRSGDEQAPAGAAQRTEQARGLEVGHRDQQARREVHEAGAPVGFETDDPAEPEHALAQFDLVANVEPQRRRQLRIGPGLAGRRDPVGLDIVRRLAAVATPQSTPQGIALADGLDRGELYPVVTAGHAREDDGPRGRKPARGSACDESGIDRPIGPKHQVGTDQVGGLAFEREFHAVDEEAHRGDRRHGDDQRAQQEVQFAGAPVAPRQAKREQEEVQVEGPARGRRSVRGWAASINHRAWSGTAPGRRLDNMAGPRRDRCRRGEPGDESMPPRIPYQPADLAEPAEVVDAIRQRRGGELLELDRMLLHSAPLAARWNAMM